MITVMNSISSLAFLIIKETMYILIVLQHPHQIFLKKLIHCTHNEEWSLVPNSRAMILWQLYWSFVVSAFILYTVRPLWIHMPEKKSVKWIPLSYWWVLIYDIMIILVRLHQVFYALLKSNENLALMLLMKRERIWCDQVANDLSCQG